MDLTTVADELYGLLPEEFTAARNDRAKQARDAGDRELADAVRALRRPTTSAWLANLLVRERGDQVDDLLDLGAALREAQGRLAGEALRELSRQRHQVVATLAHDARRLAADAGQPVSEQVERELEGTLDAALADPAAGDALRSGRLTTGLRYSGLGPVDVGDAVATPLGSDTGHRPAARKPAKPAGRDKPAKRTGRDEQRRVEIAAAEQAVREARQAAEEAARDVETQQRRTEEARQRRDDIRVRIAKLERQLEQLAGDQAAAARELRDAEHARDAAARAARSAGQRLERARASLDRLRG